MTSDGFLQKYFGLLSGDNSIEAYPWQKELFNRITHGDWPDSVALPTGTGKTSILKIWLIALGWALLNGKASPIPRRLAWVVNRRVVVDQATQEAEAMSGHLSRLRSEGDEFAAALANCSAEKTYPLAISTLRGQKADNRQWSQDPLAPAIIVGTVDMIGSRILFRGYRDGKYYRPYHAGLLGVDTLLVNDESHLTPAFAKLLSSLEGMKPAAAVGKQFRVIFVSATKRQEGTRPFDHDIEIDAKNNSRFRLIYQAEKLAHLHESSDPESTMLELALTEPVADRTIIFIDKPEHASRFAERIRKAKTEGQVVLLTGTMRGLERDQLSRNDIFQKFQQRSAASDGPYYLVSTSAGEVGVDISGERMITMLRESDVLMQRLGRLNRFGDQEGESHRSGNAHIVFDPKKLPEEGPEIETLEHLRRLVEKGGGVADVSCRALRIDPPPFSTFSETPLLATLDGRLIELWSQTTAPTSGAPQMPFVESWLHGKDDNIPETELAWRRETELLALDGVSIEDRETALERYRVLPRETLKEPTRRLRDKLRNFPAAEQDKLALFQSRDGTVEACTVRDLTDESKWPDYDLAEGLILLPEECGWLSLDGMLKESPTDGKSGNDVADINGDSAIRRRYLATRNEGRWSIKPLGNIDDTKTGLADWRLGLAEQGGRLLKIVLPRENEEDSERFLILQTNIGGAAAPKKEEVELEVHLKHVEHNARLIASLALPTEQESYGLAGRLHDQGKDCTLWQKAMGGNTEKPLAKTKKPSNPRLLSGYRHELGSLLKAAATGMHDDLFLHLVASHHGWARPYWEKSAHDPDRTSEVNARAVLDAAHRFSRLQTKWGPWGLAYLESLFKAADGMASRQEANLSDE